MELLKMQESLCMACTDEFAAALPDGLQTRAGKKGLDISEGQAQRIAIALPRPAPIPILDEATFALDEPALFCLSVSPRRRHYQKVSGRKIRPET